MKKILAVLVIVLISLFTINPTSIYAKESKSCKTIDGAYYGKNGKETDKGTYEKECVSHKCELVADAYFGKDGKEVSQEQFEKECEANVVENIPDTGNNNYVNVLFLLLGLSIVSFSVLKVASVKE